MKSRNLTTSSGILSFLMKHVDLASWKIVITADRTMRSSTECLSIAIWARSEYAAGPVLQVQWWPDEVLQITLPSQVLKNKPAS